MTHPLRPLGLLGLLATLALAGCSLTDDEPLAPGTFEVVVTGDAEGRHAGGPVYVAAPDSAPNVTDRVWTTYVPVAFESSLADGDGAEVVLEVIEPSDPDGPFTEVPEGTFEVSGRPSRPGVFVRVVVARRSVTASDGELRVRRTAGGLVGDLDARYVEPRVSGEVLRGRIRLRFHALAERPSAPGESKVF